MKELHSFNYIKNALGNGEFTDSVNSHTTFVADRIHTVTGANYNDILDLIFNNEDIDLLNLVESYTIETLKNRIDGITLTESGELTDSDEKIIDMYSIYEALENGKNQRQVKDEILAKLYGV